MRAFIPSYNRADAQLTTQLAAFAAVNWHVVVHDETQAALYVKAGIPRERLAVSNVPVSRDGLGKARQIAWIFKNLVEPGEWVVLADDDIDEITGVADPALYCREELQTTKGGASFWNTAFGQPIGPEEFTRILDDSIAKAESIGANLIGFSYYPNPFWRGKKFHTSGYVCGRLTVWRYEPDYEFEHGIHMEDLRDTAEHVYRDGVILLNLFMWPGGRFWHQEGGHGTFEERGGHRAEAMAKLQQLYPGFFRAMEQRGVPDLRPRLHTARQVQKWRDLMAVEVELR